MFNFSEIGSEKQEKNFENKNGIYPDVGINVNYLTSNSIIANNLNLNNAGLTGNEFLEPKNMQNVSFFNSENFANQFMVDMKENNSVNYMNLVGAKLPSMAKRYAIKQ